MTEKRFELSMNGDEVAQYEIIDHNQEILTIYNNLGNVYFSSAMKICELLNSLADENEQLKQQLNEVKNDENQLSISFMEFKMKLKDNLQKHYDYATEQRQKNLDDLFVAKACEIIKHDIKALAVEMGVDLE